MNIKFKVLFIVTIITFLWLSQGWQVQAAQASQSGSFTLLQGGPGPFSGMAEKFSQDPLANSIAVIVLIIMLASVIITLYRFVAAAPGHQNRWPDWVLPVLALLGLFVAFYMTYAEVSKANVICGPIGNCNAVQESPYAILFGVLPVGILGALGYLGIFGAWLVQRFGNEQWHKIGVLAIWGMALFGIIFSIYLTFLEAFVIGATCAWCITSAIIITLISWISTDLALDVLQEDDALELDNEPL